MKYRSVLSPGAKADISSAVRWYQRKDPSLAFRFTMEALTTLRRIKQSPYQFPVITGRVRRALLKRVPYAIYFYLDEDRAVVRAVVHQRRSDIIWMDRGNGSY
jgi:plasmid stabilization system protein ParE